MVEACASECGNLEVKGGGGCPGQNFTVRMQSLFQNKNAERTEITEINKGKMGCESLGTNFR